EKEFAFTLPEGEHQVSVLARGPDSSGVSDPVAVKQVTPAKLPMLYVRAVGVSDYKDKSLALQFAAVDAKAIAAGFKAGGHAGLFRDADSKALVDGDATCDKVRAALAEVRKEVKPNDLVVVFFAGHGVKEKDQFYLLTAEADTSNLAKTTLSGAELRKMLAEF